MLASVANKVTPLGEIAESPDLAANTSTSGSVAVGGSIGGSLDVAGDHDWYAVQLTAGQTNVFNLNGAGGSPVSDTVFNLYSSGGALLSSNDDDGSSFYSQITYTAATATSIFPAAAAATTRLRGGKGSDWLVGGDGSDAFRFDASDLAAGQVDVIQDFQGIGTGFDWVKFVGVSYSQLGFYDQGSSAVIQALLSGGGSSYIDIRNFSIARLSDQYYFT